MRFLQNSASRLLAVSAVAAAASAQTSIPSVVVTLENAQVERGVFLTPPWIGIHDGSFDSYDGGQPASVPLGGNEIEALAEDGDNGPITATFEALLPAAPQVMAVPGPAGPLGPGTATSVTLNVNPATDRYFSFASMILPSNDFFIANGNPVAHELFDPQGNFVGRSFIVSGDESNDAGTEVNDEIAANVAFLGQAAPNTGTTENLPVQTPAPGFAPPGTFALPNGILNFPVLGNGDFNDADDRLLQVSFRFVDLGGIVPFMGTLDAAQEIQPDVVDSVATGSAIVVSRDAQFVNIRVETESLTGPLTAAHLHLSQAGSNGPVVVDLGGSIVGGNAVRARIDASQLTGPLAGATTLDLVNALAAGNVYVNLHTAAFPDGEIRGQLGLAQ